MSVVIASPLPEALILCLISFTTGKITDNLLPISSNCYGQVIQEVKLDRVMANRKAIANSLLAVDSLKTTPA